MVRVVAVVAGKAPEGEAAVHAALELEAERHLGRKIPLGGDILGVEGGGVAEADDAGLLGFGEPDEALREGHLASVVDHVAVVRILVFARIVVGAGSESAQQAELRSGLLQKRASFVVSLGREGVWRSGGPKADRDRVFIEIQCKIAVCLCQFESAPRCAGAIGSSSGDLGLITDLMSTQISHLQAGESIRHRANPARQGRRSGLL